MAAIISLQNIQQVVSNLPYPSAKSLKSRLVQAIMQYYNDADTVRTLQIIPAEALIQALWQTGDDSVLIRKKQKNLSSVRSSVNIDLKKLGSNGKNPDGLQVSNDNIFVMSDEAKDKVLNEFLDKLPRDTPASLDEITKILQMVDGMLSNLNENATNESADRQHFVTELKSVIDGITEKISSDGFQSDNEGKRPSEGIDSGYGSVGESSEDRDAATQEIAPKSADLSEPDNETVEPKSQDTAEMGGSAGMGQGMATGNSELAAISDLGSQPVDVDEIEEVEYEEPEEPEDVDEDEPEELEFEDDADLLNDEGNGGNTGIDSLAGEDKSANAGQGKDLGNGNGDGDDVASDDPETELVDTEDIEDIDDDELEELEFVDDVDPVSSEGDDGSAGICDSASDNIAQDAGPGKDFGSGNGIDDGDSDNTDTGNTIGEDGTANVGQGTRLGSGDGAGDKAASNDPVLELVDEDEIQGFEDIEDDDVDVDIIGEDQELDDIEEEEPEFLNDDEDDLEELEFVDDADLSNGEGDGSNEGQAGRAGDAADGNSTQGNEIDNGEGGATNVGRGNNLASVDGDGIGPGLSDSGNQHVDTALSADPEHELATEDEIQDDEFDELEFVDDADLANADANDVESGSSAPSRDLVDDAQSNAPESEFPDADDIEDIEDDEVDLEELELVDGADLADSEGEGRGGGSAGLYNDSGDDAVEDAGPGKGIGSGNDGINDGDSDSTGIGNAIGEDATANGGQIEDLGSGNGDDDGATSHEPELELVDEDEIQDFEDVEDDDDELEEPEFVSDVDLEELEFVDDTDLSNGNEDSGSANIDSLTGDNGVTNAGGGKGLGRGAGNGDDGTAHDGPDTNIASDDSAGGGPGVSDADNKQVGALLSTDPESDLVAEDEIEDDDDVDLEELEFVTDDDDDELEKPEFVNEVDLEELEFVDDEEPVESAGDSGETNMGGPGNTDGTAGTHMDKASEGGYDNPESEQYNEANIADQMLPDNPSTDNGLDRVEAMGVEDIPDWSRNPQKAELLAEEFNRSLAAMDKFYNQYVKIPAGGYILGYKQSKGTQKSEASVQLPEYYIGKFPVTNALFELFIEKTGYQTTAEKQGKGTVYTGRSQHITDPQTGQEHKVWHADIQYQTIAGACWYQPRGPGSTIHKKRNHPVVQVSLQDAMAFAAWTGKRLPSETEWEAAARTTESLVFPWGNAWQSQGCNIEESGVSDTTAVDCYLEFINSFGVADTLGNVLEWTSCTANGDARAAHSAYYIVKGGSWISGPDIGLFSQFQQTSDGHSNLLGFRCVAF